MKLTRSSTIDMQKNKIESSIKQEVYINKYKVLWNKLKKKYDGF